MTPQRGVGVGKARQPAARPARTREDHPKAVRARVASTAAELMVAHDRLTVDQCLRLAEDQERLVNGDWERPNSHLEPRGFLAWPPGGRR